MGGYCGRNVKCLLKATCLNIWFLTGSIIWGGCGVLGNGGDGGDGWWRWMVGDGGYGSQVVGLFPS